MAVTPAFGGFTGKVFISIDGMNTWIPVGAVKDATISGSTDDIDVTNFDSIGWAENIPSFNRWEMSMEALYLYGNDGQTNVEDAFLGGQVVAWQFMPKLASGNKGYQGEGFVNSYEVNVPVDDAVNLSLNIMGAGYLETLLFPAP